MNLVFKWISSPVGPLKLVGDDAALSAILWENDNPRRVRLGPLAEEPDHHLLVLAERQLADYFRGERMAFDVPLAFDGTPFQVKVWQALVTIPYGETRSYGAIARQIGQPSAMRAVGAANEQPDLDHGAVPSCGRRVWRLDRFRRRPRSKAHFAGAGSWDRAARSVNDPEGMSAHAVPLPPGPSRCGRVDGCTPALRPARPSVAAAGRG